MKKYLILTLIGVSLVLLPVVCLAATFAYTNLQLALAEARDGVINSPEEGMLSILQDSNAWVGVERIEIERAGQNSHSGKQPHVLFVTAKVYAERRWNGKSLGPRGYDYAGSYILHTKEGWVHVPEGAFPELVGWGFPSPFAGYWQAIDDFDGSDIRLVIAGYGMGPYRITWTESYLSFCDGGPGIVKGYGWLDPVDPTVLEADLYVRCFKTDKSTTFHQTWNYDPGTDTISDGVTTWHHPGFWGYDMQRSPRIGRRAI